jgi:hemerythrin-like domain-containing protein
MGKATQDLRNEHEAILHVLDILDKVIANKDIDEKAKLQFADELVYFLQIFADKCHHGKEENYLFAELVKNGVPNEGGPVGVMLQEHKLGREYIAEMSAAQKAGIWEEFTVSARKYYDLLQAHIMKENNVLFMMADRMLNESMQDELFKKFEEHEENVIGHGVHEKLHAKIHEWESQFLA